MLSYFIVNAWFAFELNWNYETRTLRELEKCRDANEAATSLIDNKLVSNKLKESDLLKAAFGKSPGTRPLHQQLEEVLQSIVSGDKPIRKVQADKLYHATTGNRSGIWTWCFWVVVDSVSEDKLFVTLDQASNGSLEEALRSDPLGGEKKTFVKKLAGRLANEMLPSLRWIRRFNGWVQWLTIWLTWLIVLIVARRAFMTWRLSQVTKTVPFDSGEIRLSQFDEMLTGCLRELHGISESASAFKGNHADRVSVLHDKMDRLRDQLESDVYTQLGYLLSLLPSLGFIGTVIGMGEALLRADGLFSHDDRQQTISLITQELGFAFDTTLVALCAGILTGAVISWQRQREHEWLKDLPNDWLPLQLTLFSNTEAARHEQR
jgi:biopolymer transport protein ExbB/TolQ